MPANFTIDLLAGESMTVAGPGTLDFTIPEIARTTAMTGQANMAAPAAGKGLATAGKGLTKGLVVNSATTTAAQSGTIWSGKGLSLGLGLGLGAWGPVLVVAAAAGGYLYWRKKNPNKTWPFAKG
ncbi:MAG: hypothetical protein H7839_19455 [Magnetococcus sp. YQC-5]